LNKVLGVGRASVPIGVNIRGVGAERLVALDGFVQPTEWMDYFRFGYFDE
jgi:hypothetical protein